MKKTTLALGMHDKLFKRARTMYQIEHCICDLLMTKGFLRIETPTLEHFEVFSDVVDNGNYNFFDKNGIAIIHTKQATVIVLMSVILIRLPYLDKRSIMSSKYYINI